MKKIFTPNVIQGLSIGRSFIQLLCFIAFALGAFFLNFPTYFLNLFFFIWMMLNAVDLLIRGKYRFELPNKNNIHLYLLAVMYLWMLASALWSVNSAETGKMLMRRLSLIVFPFLILMGLNNFFRLKYIMAAFILGSICSVITLSIIAYGQYQIHHEWFHEIGLSKTVAHVITMYKHRTYFSMCLIFSLIFYVYLKDSITRRIPHSIYYAGFAGMYVLFTAIIYLSESRMSFIILLAVSGFLAFSFLLKRNMKKTLIVFVLVFAAGSSFLILNHDRMETLELNREKLQDFDPRYDLLSVTIQGIKESNKILGTGIGDAVDVFEEIHHRSQYQEHFYPATDGHNEFLKTQFELGIVGTLLLLALIVSVFINMRNQWPFIINIMIVWLLFMLIETIGITSPSTYMFAFCMMLIYLAKTERDNPDRRNEFIHLYNQCKGLIKR